MQKITAILGLILMTLSLTVGDAFSQDTPAEQAPADTSYWEAGGTATFTFSQVGLTNWASGGESSVSGNGGTNLFLNYNKDKLSWENFLGVAYGLMKQGEQSVRKTDDKLEAYSKFGYRASKKWFYTGMAKFNTQFTDGFDYPDDSTIISRFMAPGYLNLSLGMDYKPNKEFSLYLAPVSGKVTWVMDDSLSARGAYGVDPGENTRAEFGGYVKASFTRDVIENVNLLTKIDLFSNYIENPHYIDVSWELTLTMTVNQYLKANVHTHMIFDKDITQPVYDDAGAEIGEEAKVQFKEVIGVGLQFSF